jgi:hypothetical protein
MIYNPFLPEPLPPILYHYTSPESVHSIFETRKLRASDLRFLNDAAEYTQSNKAYDRFMQQRLDRAASDAERALADGARCDRDRLGLTPDRRPIYVFALSSDSDSLSQWRAYCPQTGGIAVGFDTAKLLELYGGRSDADRTSDAQPLRLNRCYYETEEIRKLFEQAWSRAVARPSDTDVAQALALECWQMAPFIKDWAFRDESEWRVVHETPSDGGEPFLPVEWRPARAMIVPFISLDFDDFAIVKEIVVGPSLRRDLAAAAMTAYLATKGLLEGRRVRISEIPYREP